MSTELTIRQLAAFEQNAPQTNFFSRYFRSPQENFYSSQEVEFDIERDDEDIAVAIDDLSTKYNYNAYDKYTSKRFKAPLFREAVAFNSSDLLKRVAGENPFQDPNFLANINVRMIKSMRKLSQKIQRTKELQAAQVLQSGVITLSNEDGDAVYTLGFFPKPSHFSTVAAAWDTVSAAPLSDIELAGELNRADGKIDSNTIIMGSNAWNAFVAVTDVQNLLDNRRFDLGNLGGGVVDSNGATFKGVLNVAGYGYNVWTYNGIYKDPQSARLTPYMDPDRIIVMSDQARLDATFGNVPNIGRELNINQGIMPGITGRLESTNLGMDLHTNVWLTEGNEELVGSVSSRPLMIPTQIDSFSSFRVTNIEF